MEVSFLEILVKRTEIGWKSGQRTKRSLGERHSHEWMYRESICKV